MRRRIGLFAIAFVVAGLVAFFVVHVSRARPRATSPSPEDVIEPTVAPPSVVRLPSRWPVLAHAQEESGDADAPPLEAGPIVLACDDTGKCGECARASDCQETEDCLFVPSHGQYACQASTCKTDDDCGGTDRCIHHGRISVCRATGEKYQGERCSNFERCQFGLRCIEGHCGTDCDLARPTSCQAGYRCTATLNGAACVQTDCRVSPCYEGEACVAWKNDEHRCVNAIGKQPPCFDKGCPHGTTCFALPHPDGVAFGCKPACTDGGACRAGETCMASGVCAIVCDPSRAGVCPAGEACLLRRPHTGDAEWACLPVGDVIEPATL